MSEATVKCLDGKVRVVVKANKKGIEARVPGARGPAKKFPIKALKSSGKNFVEVEMSA